MLTFNEKRTAIREYSKRRLEELKNMSLLVLDHQSIVLRQLIIEHGVELSLIERMKSGEKLRCDYSDGGSFSWTLGNETVNWETNADLMSEIELAYEAGFLIEQNKTLDGYDVVLSEETAQE